MTQPPRIRNQRIAGLVNRGTGRLRRVPQLRRLFRPTVTVVVPFYNVEEYLEECLHSLVGQGFVDFEALLVDDGSLDGSLAIAERFASEDPRLRIIRQANGGLGAARNTGVRHARGRYLTFIDSDDRLPAGALAALVGSARRTGSEIVVGSVRRFDRSNSWRPAWVGQIHAVERLGTTLAEFPALLRNLYTWDKLYRRDFFLAQGLWFREGTPYEDQPIVSQLLLRARAVDVLTDVVYHYRNREDRSSISQQTWTLKDLQARLRGLELTEQALAEEAPEQVRLAWLQTVFDSHLIWYLKSSGVEDDEFWTTLRTAVLRYTENAPAVVWERTIPVSRVLLELARQDRRGDLAEVAALARGLRDEARSRPQDDGILLELPGYDDPTLPAALFVERPEQIEMLHSIEHLAVETSGDPVLRVRGWGYLRRIDLASHDQQVSLVLRGRRSGATLEFDSCGRPPARWPAPYEDLWNDYANGTFEVAVPLLDLAGAAPAPETWQVELRVRACGFDRRTPVTTLVRAGSAGTLPVARLPQGTRVVPRWAPHEQLRLRVLAAGPEGDRPARDRPAGAVVRTAEVTEEGLRLTGTVGDLDRPLVLRARSSRAQVAAEVDLRDREFAVTLPWRNQVFRFGPRPLPHGDYALTLHTSDGRELPLRHDPELGATLPVMIATDVHEGRVVRTPEGNLRLTLQRPIGAARGKFAQHRLQTQPLPGSLTRGVLFRSYFGEKATDNGIAIQAELRRRGCDLPVYWAVHDHAVPVPDGGIPVVVNSAEWYSLLGSIQYYVDNMYQPTYHRKPAGQVIVQTFHGYPFKQMGHPHWANLGFDAERIASYDARARDWDYLVSPARYASPLLTRDFNYHGQVLEIGYPRNDVLFGPQADVLRDQVRESLGIRPDQTVVLYAPTFRDYLSPDDQRAEMVDFFDFAEAHRSLGDGVVFLVRGHAFNARTSARVATPGVIDVTDYPEVSDLYLAADAAVVDYSSLRFDFGVTGKPMVFHVPDLQRYVETRGWLFDFAPTAPGPLVETTAEVVAALADLDRLRPDYSEPYERFRRDYLDLEDGHAAARFVDAVMGPRGDG